MVKLTLLRLTGKRLGFVSRVRSLKHVDLTERSETMPKDKAIPKHVKNRNDIEKEPAPRIDIQVVGTGAKGTPRSAMIHFRDAKYLFNCGAGTQRIVNEQGMKLTRIGHILITHKSWENLGGLTGMTLSMASGNIDGCHLHGPPNLEPIIGRGFFAGEKYLKDFKHVKHEIHDQCYESKMVRVEYVPIYPAVEESGSSSPVPKRRKISEDDMSIVYVIKPTPKLRAINLEKCVEVGISSGPIIGKLKNNQEVTLPDGKVVTPEQVLDPPIPAGVVIVLECPSLDYLDSLVKNERLRTLQTANEGDEPVVTILHMTPQEILEQPNYKLWMEAFGDSTKHLILNESCSPTSLEFPYFLQRLLNQLHPDIFPLLNYPIVPLEDTDDITEKKTIKGETGLSYIYRPDATADRGFSRATCINHGESKYEKEAFDNPLFVESLQSLQKKIKEEEYKKSAVFEYFKDKKYPEIVFLGTASAAPGSGRNVSAVLVHTNPDTCILLDVGENTDGQIFRNYGPDAEDVFRKLKAIYVSHLHADHHMGLVGVALARRKAFEAVGQEPPPIDVLCPLNLKEYIKNLNDNIVPCAHLFRFSLLEDLMILSQEDKPKRVRLRDSLQLSELKICRVFHVKHSFGVRLNHSDGWSLSYSGDTKPCGQFVELSKDVDIMIHEATMEDEMLDEAKTKKHSTTSQAISIGQQANAKFLLLTHFSQRYAKVPYLPDDIPENIGIAFDNMRVKPEQLAILPLLMAPFKHMFASYVEDMESKAFRRRIRKK